MELGESESRDLAIEKGIERLLGCMTLEEKAGQMMLLPANLPGMVDVLEEKHIGGYLHVTGNMADDLQDRARKTRLGIPLLFGIDAIHGHWFHPGGTVFPTQLAQACSWDPDLVERICAVTAKEVRASGIHWTFSPVLCIARDLRWGRVGETYGEDPWLIGLLGRAAVRGYQGTQVSNSGMTGVQDEHPALLLGPDAGLACAKHFAAYGESTGGRDSYEAEVSPRKLHELFLPPFEQVVREAGCGTMMAGYQAIDGLPCSANPYLLRTIAKESWKFPGFIVTDWDNVGALHTRQRVAKDLAVASLLAIRFGNDMIMNTMEMYDHLIRLVAAGTIAESELDDCVRRILRQKALLGLFGDPPFGDGFERVPHQRALLAPQGDGAYLQGCPENVIGCEEHIAVALEASRASLVLLENRQLLPLMAMEGRVGISTSPSPFPVKNILVLGDSANDPRMQLGDWSFASMQAGSSTETFHAEQTITIAEGISMRAAEAGMSCEYIRGCDSPADRIAVDEKSLSSALDRSDLVCVCVGDTLEQQGEMHDRSDLSLASCQRYLLDRVIASGRPCIIILLASKPLCLGPYPEQVQALICAFNPGSQGGKAVAELIFGDIEPQGRLTISFPRSSGQNPVHYLQYPGWHTSLDPRKEGSGKYIDADEGPRYPFGYGLSYTSFKIDTCSIADPVLKEHEPVTISCRVMNTGARMGYEVIQVYVRDLFGSMTRPDRHLCAFRKILLQPGEERMLSFTIPCTELALLTRDLRRVVEAGEFEALIGTSSRTRDLQAIPFRVTVSYSL